MVADALSRDKPISSEWTLDQESFHFLCSQAGTPQIDLFATRENRRTKKFISPIVDSLSEGVDAFTCDWNKWNIIYLFPPTKMILRVLSQLESFQGTALLVTPAWTGQPWYPIVQSRSKSRIPLPNPSLSQLVGGTRCFCCSKILLQLTCWVL